MTNTNLEPKDFEKARADWFGWAVSMRRKALDLTANELARRTEGLGYPISRSTIAKIESNLRSGKIDVAEVLVLAAALDIPPVLLLFPQIGTDGGAIILPKFRAKEDDAVRWMSGALSFPQEYDIRNLQLKGQPEPPNDGVKLVAALSLIDELLETRIALVDHLHKVQEHPAEARNAQRMLDKNDEQIEAARKQKVDAQKALWGTRFASDKMEEPAR
ncbi:MAG: helix-turn-helix transcriptional regulator [Mycobacterium sp.]